MEENHIVDSLIIELRRGTQIMIVLNALKKEAYGYQLLQTLNDLGVNIEAGTLYPLLRRLENQGLLESTWDTSESRPRKFYQLSDLGFEVLDQLKEAWLLIHEEMAILFKENK
ncbi:MAG: PadR family transcriptional regulator [Acholeplasmataceae bacterium]